MEERKALDRHLKSGDKLKDAQHWCGRESEKRIAILADDVKHTEQIWREAQERARKVGRMDSIEAFEKVVELAGQLLRRADVHFMDEALNNGDGKYKP